MATQSLIPSDSPLRRLHGLRRLHRNRISVLVVRNDYHVQAECIRALRTLGHRVIEVRLGEKGGVVAPQENIEAVLQAVVKHRPDLLLSINYTGFDRMGWMTEALDAVGLPTAVWVVDSPLFMVRGLLPLNARRMALFCWDRTYVPIMRQLGQRHVYHLPLATCPQLFADSRPLAHRRFDKTFVGHSLVVLEERWRKRLGPEEVALGEVWAKKLLDSRNCLHALVPDPQPPVDNRALILAFANMLASKLYRKQQLAAICDDSLHVFGDEHWSTLLPGAHTHPSVAYGAELGRVFASSAININATNLQMPSTVNQRVFDVPQAGGFLLTDRQDELAEYFELEHEMASFSTPEELKDKTAFYLRHDQERAAMVARARRRILAEHTYAHRLEKLIANMRDLSATQIDRSEAVANFESP